MKLLPQKDWGTQRETGSLFLSKGKEKNMFLFVETWIKEPGYMCVDK